jgi:hypothetical protein
MVTRKSWNVLSKTICGTKQSCNTNGCPQKQHAVQTYHEKRTRREGRKTTYIYFHKVKI